MRFSEFKILNEVGIVSKPGAPKTKDKSTIEVPAGRKGMDVAKIQQALVSLGYNLPKYGIDGIRGPETDSAIRDFQQKNGLVVDGTPGTNTVDKLNDLVAADPEVSKAVAGVKFSTLSQGPKLGQAFGKVTGAPTQSAKKAVDFFVSKGYTKEQAAGIVGNLQAESGPNLNISALGDGGKAYGIAQWHPDRQADFKRAMGKDIRGSSLDDQLNFVVWELSNTEKSADSFLRSTDSPEEAAFAFDKYYERSSGAHRDKRMALAASLVDKDTTQTT